MPGPQTGRFVIATASEMPARDSALHAMLPLFNQNRTHRTGRR